MLRPLLAALLSLVLAEAVFAAPVSIKELDLLVRMRTPDQEIMTEVIKRRLLAPLDPAAEQMLVKNGASPALIEQLKSGKYLVSSQEAGMIQANEAQQRALIAKEKADDAAAYAALQNQQQKQVAAPVSDKMRRLFEGKLVRMENGSLRSYSADELKTTRYYALYYSAHWCGPCRKFTPKLIEFYQRFKAQYPSFEVIFVSSDYNPAGMQEYMRSSGMPWPAVKYESISKEIRGMAGSGIPWLGIFNAAGEPVSENGKTKKWVDPNTILTALDQAVAESAAR